MASGVLASRNESSWGQARAGFMAKTLISNSSSNPNPNPNPNSKKHQIYANGGVGGGLYNGRCVDESPSVAQSASDDASSLIQKPFNNGSGFNRGSYISLSLASCSKREAMELKNRLVDELDRIRYLAGRIENGELGGKKASKKASKPQVSGSKRANPFALKPAASSSSSNAGLMKMCDQVLGKLIKHKSAWIFNKPVDVVGMGLHDYFQVVKNPMDLGTAKTKLTKGIYQTPVDFAADVRLTFENAMLYNPKGHEVYRMAEVLLAKFEDWFRPIYRKFLDENLVNPDRALIDVDDEVQESSWNRAPPKEKVKKLNHHTHQPSMKKSFSGDRFDSMDHVQPSASASNPPPPPPLVQSPVPIPSSPVRAPPVKPSVTKTASNAKLPKPKARDPNKREMSMDEKQRLGMGLQSLPQEKMVQVVQIIKKRNGHLTDEGDEIELDIEAIDRETLWELDRFVTNWKKMVSKIKRQSLMDNNAAPSDDRLLGVDERSNVAAVEKRPKKGDAGDEDVDIGDEIPVSSFPPVEIEKDDGPATSSSSSSSSSSSDDSSSSDSDSGSSSGSDSDAEDIQSRGPESKNFYKT